MRPDIPKSIKFLLIALAAGTLLPFQAYLGLSYAGLFSHFYWQPITYFLSASGAADGRLISLLFNAYLIWTFGSSIRMMRGDKTLLTLFLGGGAFAGSICAYIMWHIGATTLLIGATPAINALLMGWLMLNSDATLRLFFSIPMRASWVVLGLTGVNLYMTLSNGQYIFALASFLGLTFGYFYGVIAMKCYGPLPSLHKFERILMRRKKSSSSKIYNFKDHF